MKRRIAFVGSLLLFSVQVYTKAALGQSWEALPLNVGRGNIGLIAVHPKRSDHLFAGRGGALFASFDRRKNWKELFNLGPRTEINRIYFMPDGRWFLLTSDGVFESKNQGQSWSRIFQGSNHEERNALSLALDPSDGETFYLGTRGGLFQSRDNAKTWQKDTNGFIRKQIHMLQADPENQELFIASNEGLVRLNTQTKRLDRVYQIRNGLDFDELSVEMDESDFEETPDFEQIHSIIIESRPVPFVAMGTTNGVFISEDEGNHWEQLPLSGLEETKIVDLIYSAEQNRFFAATEKGIYFYDPRMKFWKKLYEGLTETQINKIAFVSSDPKTLYAAGQNGIYQWIIEIQPTSAEGINTLLNANWPLLLNLFQYEPSVRMVQKEAIQYANVSHWKTRRWQWASRVRSLIPSLSIGKGFSKSDSIDLDRGSTSEPDTYIIGPRDTSQRLDFDLKWELSDLLFSSSQTSIDLREKSMVELRDDILNEVTRLYFERRRAQTEFVLNPPQGPMERAVALLRIEELTANLDSLTDGYFTKELEKIHSQHPEFRTLWNIQEP